MKANSQSTNQQEETIKQVWNYLLKEGDPVIELRGLHPLSKTTQLRHLRRSDHPDPAAYKAVVEQKALELNDQGYNVYTTLNSIKPDFCGNAAKDQDVQSRRMLLIDIDRSGDTKQPANEEEAEYAKTLAQEVSTYLGILGWPDPTRMMSGNGHHLYYRLTEIENNAETKNLIKRTLLNLATRFNTPEVSIDTSVFNASRITKIPGTIARKGVESESRPYRMAVVL
jgi:hypothetical protein